VKHYDVVVVGEINPDLVLSGDVIPVFGQVEKLVEDAALTIGSSSAIFACGAARLGLRVAIIGKVGEDEFGRFMLRSLQAHNVDTTGVVVDPAVRTGLSVILSRGNDRAILTYPGAIPSLQVSDINLALLRQARHLHLGSYFIQDALCPDVPALFELAHRQGLTVSLDTNYDPAERWDHGLAQALPWVDIFLPNATECQAISGSKDLSQAVEILARQVQTLVVKLGAHGALARRGDQTAQVESIPVQVVDTVGAGDSFDAGFIYAFLSRWDLARALHLGVVCGALSTRSAGGTAAQPTLAEALSWLEVKNG
jgi:sugar/nucleoside kinase (ribokinase family)